MFFFGFGLGGIIATKKDKNRNLKEARFNTGQA
jgi:hypothetical protein